VTRFALIGGIYSNWRALETTLSDIARRQVDATFCLGDLGAFGPYPGPGVSTASRGGRVVPAGKL
jgi:hypothetical protein